MWEDNIYLTPRAETCFNSYIQYGKKHWPLLDTIRLENGSYHSQREALFQAKAGSEMEDEQTN